MSALSALGGYESSSDEEEKKEADTEPLQQHSKAESASVVAPQQNAEAAQVAPASALFSSLPAAEGASKLRMKKKKKKKRKKKKLSQKLKDVDEADGGMNIPILSLLKERSIKTSVQEKHFENQQRIEARQKLIQSKAPQVGPQLPPSQSPAPTPAPSKPLLMPDISNPNHGGSSLWEHNLDPRHMERDVRNYVESGGDLSKFSEHNSFATVDGTEVAAATKAMSKGEASGEKLSVGYLATNNYKRRHNISGLVNDAENFQSELEERRSKAARSKQSTRSMYGF